MTPIDVLLEAISEASSRGDSPRLRERYCERLNASLEACELYNVRWRVVKSQRESPDEAA